MLLDTESQDGRYLVLSFRQFVIEVYTHAVHIAQMGSPNTDLKTAQSIFDSFQYLFRGTLREYFLGQDGTADNQHCCAYFATCTSPFPPKLYKDFTHPPS
jgi:hypothetical protein